MHDPQLTHHIQLEIIRRMLHAPQARYSDIKPAQLEANLFMYHLKQLMKAGLIAKQDQRYILTRDGKRFADRATLSTMKISMQPKSITTLAVKRADGNWLVMERLHQPFTGYRGLPSGKIHYGETLTQAAERELLEKSGLQGVDLQLKGNVVMRFNDGDDPVNHVIAYVFYGEVAANVETAFEHQYYRTYFAPESEFYKDPYFKGHREILALLAAGAMPFVEELEFTSDY
jgi:ADP-ribose pyrophosphatase YjhB (NUDIX family)